MKFDVKRYRATLGPLEQAQIVISTAVVVAIVTIVAVRILGRYPLGWFDFTSVIIVGIFGFMIVTFTLRYGRLLEEQKQELLGLKNIAEAVNRNVGIRYLLQSVSLELKRLLQIEGIWIYLVEQDQFIAASAPLAEERADPFHPSPLPVVDSKFSLFKTPRLVKRSDAHKLQEPGFWNFSTFSVIATAPILTGETVSGAIVSASRARGGLTARNLELLTGFANQIGVALENSALIERLKRSEERYMDLFEHAPDMYHMVTKEGIIVSCNQTETEALGYTKDELTGKPMLLLYPSSYHEEALRSLEEIFSTGRNLEQKEESLITKNGSVIEVSSSTSIIYNEQRRPVSVRWAMRDITEKKRLESRVLHAQRIDSIGNLAGGIAHDFNNILTSILGSVSIMKARTKKKEGQYQMIELVETAARRGSALTRQLLTFARKEPAMHKPVLVNEVVDETLYLFERSVEKTIRVERQFHPDNLIIRGDDGQIQQSVLNLLINARDAMPSGGTIWITTDITTFPQEQTSRFTQENPKGQYAVISIRDEGIGMDPFVQSRMFEPFFTTKTMGKGTGLGLSVVYGVAQSHQGFINVESAPGKGSVFSLYFPLLSTSKAPYSPKKTRKKVTGKEHLLLVDDEKQVSYALKTMAESLGYKVTVTNTGKRALTLLKSKSNKFDLVILDLNMPEMSGREVLQKLREFNRTIPVLVSTGYGEGTEKTANLHGLINGFLQKPYQTEELGYAIRETLKHS